MNESINLCYVDMMHHCSFEHWDQQKHCHFREESRSGTKCQHCQMGEYCQNLDAYPTARTARVKVEDLPKIVDRGVGVTRDNVLDYINEAADILEENAIDHMSEFGMMPERSYVTDIWGVSDPCLKSKFDNQIRNKILRDCIDRINISPTAPRFVKERTGESILGGDGRLLGTADNPIESWRIPASRLNLSVKKVV